MTDEEDYELVPMFEPSPVDDHFPTVTIYTRVHKATEALQREMALFLLLRCESDRARVLETAFPSTPHTKGGPRGPHEQDLAVRLVQSVNDYFARAVWAARLETRHLAHARKKIEGKTREECEAMLVVIVTRTSSGIKRA